MSKPAIHANINAALHLDGSPEKIQHYYDNWVATYNRDVAEENYHGPAIIADIVNKLKTLDPTLISNQSRILDVGCGTGLVGHCLHHNGFITVDGFDLSEAMAEQAKSLGVYQHIQGGVDIMNISSNWQRDGYSVVIAAGVFTLGHVPPEALNHLLPLCKPKSYIVLSTRTRFYEGSNFQQINDQLIADQQLQLIQQYNNLPYTNDDTATYWVYRKS